MFRNARTRLTLFYLAVIMFISLLFSITIYNIASREFDSHEKSQRTALRDLFNRRLPVILPSGEFENLQKEQFDIARHRMIGRLILVNVLTLASGGLMAYIFAGRTLQPIELAHEAQKRFASDAAHELRTPLTALKLENEVILRSKDQSKPALIAQLKSNLQEINRLEGLSSSLLELAKIENKELKITEINLDQAIEQAVNNLKKQAELKNIYIKTEQANPKLKVQVNPETFHELLTILLDNAIKYSSKSSEVIIKTLKKDHATILSIIDHGPGISKEDLLHIFERFYRGEKSRTSDGYGLGLALALEIAKANNLELKANSKLKEGSTFTLIF